MCGQRGASREAQFRQNYIQKLAMRVQIFWVHEDSCPRAVEEIRYIYENKANVAFPEPAAPAPEIALKYIFPPTRC